MAEVTIEKLASDVGTTVDRLVQQFADAGIAKQSGQMVSEDGPHLADIALLGRNRVIAKGNLVVLGLENLECSLKIARLISSYLVNRHAL